MVRTVGGCNVRQPGAVTGLVRRAMAVLGQLRAVLLVAMACSACEVANPGGGDAGSTVEGFRLRVAVMAPKGSGPGDLEVELGGEALAWAQRPGSPLWSAAAEHEWTSWDSARQEPWPLQVTVTASGETRAANALDACSAFCTYEAPLVACEQLYEIDSSKSLEMFPDPLTPQAGTCIHSDGSTSGWLL
jgi:hypothetical protein